MLFLIINKSCENYERKEEVTSSRFEIMIRFEYLVLWNNQTSTLNFYEIAVTFESSTFSLNLSTLGECLFMIKDGDKYIVIIINV